MTTKSVSGQRDKLAFGLAVQFEVGSFAVRGDDIAKIKKVLAVFVRYICLAGM